MRCVVWYECYVVFVVVRLLCGCGLCVCCGVLLCVCVLSCDVVAVAVVPSRFVALCCVVL